LGQPARQPRRLHPGKMLGGPIYARSWGITSPASALPLVSNLLRAGSVPPTGEGCFARKGPGAAPDLWTWESYTLSLLRLGPGEIDTVGQKRRSNHHRIEMAIMGLGQARPFFSQLPPGGYPSVFPLWLEKGSGAVKSRRRCRGMLANRWPTLPPEVLARKSEHRTALRIWERLLLLPVRQSLSLKQMRLMTEPGAPQLRRFSQGFGNASDNQIIFPG
jgi:hypothetical protein